MSKAVRKQKVTALKIAGLAALAIQLVSTSARSDPSLLPVQGGPGGGGFFAVCPPGHFMVGLDGRTGAWIDHMRLICAQGGGTVGNPFLHGTVIGNSMGGAETQAKCPANMIVGAIEFKMVHTEGSGGLYVVNNIIISCFHNVSWEHLASVRFAANDGSEPFLLSECPQNMLAIGLHGRHGLFVDALGIVCDKF